MHESENIILRENLCRSVEKAVTEYTGYKWQVESVKDMSDFACHPCVILSDGTLPVFVKYSEETDSSRQFESEIAGLNFLSKKTGVLIPTPIGIVPVEDGTLQIMEALKPVERRPDHWKQIGKTLARIHQVRSEFHGFTRDGFHGPLHQDNTPTLDWVMFYRDCRLVPRFRLAIHSGNLPLQVASKVEKLIQRLPESGSTDVTPSLLHGDAQQNNFISTENGTYVIDPAVFYGNPEYDLALIDCWQPVPDDVFKAYMEEMPIDSGFRERRNLWRVSIYLAAVALEGQMHLSRLTNAIERYLEFC